MPTVRLSIWTVCRVVREGKDQKNNQEMRNAKGRVSIWFGPSWLTPLRMGSSRFELHDTGSKAAGQLMFRLDEYHCGKYAVLLLCIHKAQNEIYL